VIRTFGVVDLEEAEDELWEEGDEETESFCFFFGCWSSLDSLLFRRSMMLKELGFLLEAGGAVRFVGTSLLSLFVDEVGESSIDWLGLHGGGEEALADAGSVGFCSESDMIVRCAEIL